MSANKNDNPIDNIDDYSLTLNNFCYSNEFVKIATLTIEINAEKLVVNKITDKRYTNKKGLVYLFVIDNKIVKVGSSTTSMKNRIQSYNCGKELYRQNGTCSTTNYFVLQSFLRINKKIEVYGFFPEDISINVFGKIETVSIPSKNYEKRILSVLKENGEMPILCTQT